MLKKLVLLTPLVVLAKPAVFGGFTYIIGEGIEGTGATVKLLSSQEENKAVISAGASYYPWAKDKYGLDVGLGYNFDKTTVTTGWDILKNEPSVSLGVNSGTKSSSSNFNPNTIQDATCDKDELGG